MAILSKCITNFAAQNVFINQNADVYVGFVGWGAGSFSSSYVLSLTPTKQGNSYVDNTVMQQCVIDPWVNTTTTATSSVAGSSSSGAARSQSTVYITPTVTATLDSDQSTVDGATGDQTWTINLNSAATGTSDGVLLTATTSSTGAGQLLTATGARNQTSTPSATSSIVAASPGSKSSASLPVIAAALSAAAAMFFFDFF